MTIDTIDTDTAIRNWLNARENFLRQTGLYTLDRFNETNTELYVAFLQEWQGQPKPSSISQAYTQFRNVLTQEQDRGMESRMKYHSNPTILARA
jgi:hypothetical protein